VAADLQKAQDQRGKFMAHGQARKPQPRCLSGQTDAEGRPAGVIAVQGNQHPVGHRSHIGQQGLHLDGTGAVIQAGNHRNGMAQVFQIGLQLGFQALVQHGSLR